MNRARGPAALICLPILALPLVAVLAPHGLVVVFAASALIALASAPVRAEVAALLRPSPMTTVLGLSLLWMLAASFWSPDTGQSLRLWASVTAIFVGGLVLLAAARGLTPGEARMATGALAGAGVLLVGLIAVEIAFDNALVRAARELIRYQGDAVTVNNINGATALLAVLGAPLAFAVHERIARLAGLAVAAGAIIVLWFAPMEAALAAILAASLTVALAFRWPRPVLAVIMGAFAVGLVFAPLIPHYLLGAVLGGDGAEILPSAWRHRVLIWQFVAERIGERPLLGWGFDAARDIPGKGDLLFEGAPALPLHPHNGALQLWLELGPLGALLAVALALLVLGRLRRTTRVNAAIGAGVVAAWATFALVSYGAWHNWWLVVPWIGAAVSAITFRLRDA